MDVNLHKSNLATHGYNGYDMYRVPGIVTVSNGDIIVYYEGRAVNPNIRTLLCRRSRDGGTTFSEQHVLKESLNEHMVHNPMMVAGNNGELWFFWNEDYRRCYYQKSTDDGDSWGDVVNLTPFVEKMRTIYPYTVFALSPGHGICTAGGVIVLPMWMSTGVNAHQPSCFITLFSGDNGATWHHSNPLEGDETVENPSEASIAACKDGTLLATMRHGTTASRYRAFARGTYEHWQPAFLDSTLLDPICAGSVISSAAGDLIFSNCNYGDEEALKRIRAGENIKWSQNARQNLTIRISEDDGANWSKGIAVEEEAGYSDLAFSLDGKEIYCFYERGWIDGNCIYNEHLAFARVPIASV